MTRHSESRMRNAINRELTASKRAAGIKAPTHSDRSADAEWMRQMALVSHDARDLTGRLMGDPNPADPRRMVGGAA